MGAKKVYYIKKLNIYMDDKGEINQNIDITKLTRRNYYCVDQKMYHIMMH